MKTFILIHGSWHGAWNWHKVVPLLEKQGYTAIAVDLPGMGRDKTPIADVSIKTTVEKICSLIDSIDGQVILLGHSKNGIIVSQAAEYRPDKIEKLIYLAANLIPNGKTQRDYSLQDKEAILRPYVTQYPELNAHTLQKVIYKEGLYHDCGDDIIQLANVLLSHETAESAITPLQLTEENYGRVPRYYIECLQDRAITPFLQHKMYTEMPCKKVYSMDTSHSPFFSRPEELVNILCEIATD